MVEMLLRRADEPRVISLRGNHDQYLVDFLDDADCEDFGRWMRYGGIETLMSYGIDLGHDAHFDRRGRELLHAALKRRVPQAHHTFLGGLPLSVQLGDYFFAHAGVRPGVALDDQSPRDLMWIREPFLSSDADLGAVVVHGHTPEDAVITRPNRIGIDTGAVFGGRLACLVLEGRSRALLQPDGLRPV